jgi:hypothetical protein
MGRALHDDKILKIMDAYANGLQVGLCSSSARMRLLHNIMHV